MMSQSIFPVLVSYHARWAEVIGPALSEPVKEVAGRLQAVRIDVIAYPLIAERVKVRILPTALIFKYGVPVECEVFRESATGDYAGMWNDAVSPSHEWCSTVGRAGKRHSEGGNY